MSSELPYEAPTRTRNPVSSEADPGMPLMPENAPAQPREGLAFGEPAPLPEGLAEEQAKLLQALASYERQEIERVLAGFYDTVMRMLDERLVNLHDPKTVFMDGVRYGAIAVLTALVVMLLIGLLFLLGLTIVRAAG